MEEWLQKESLSIKLANAITDVYDLFSVFQIIAVGHKMDLCYALLFYASNSTHDYRNWNSYKCRIDELTCRDIYYSKMRCFMKIVSEDMLFVSDKWAISQLGWVIITGIGDKMGDIRY